MKWESPYRTVCFPKCPYCKHEYYPDIRDYSYGQMVAMVNNTGSKDVVVKCKNCQNRYRVTVTIRFNARAIRENTDGSNK